MVKGTDIAILRTALSIFTRLPRTSNYLAYADLGAEESVGEFLVARKEIAEIANGITKLPSTLDTTDEAWIDLGWFSVDGKAAKGELENKPRTRVAVAESHQRHKRDSSRHRTGRFHGRGHPRHHWCRERRGPSRRSRSPLRIQSRARIVAGGVSPGVDSTKHFSVSGGRTRLEHCLVRLPTLRR